MAKYYVQSGTLRTVVQAEESRKAALWAVHQVMQQVIPLDEDSPSATSSEPAVLSAKIKINERGFDHEDSQELRTMDVVTEWNQMVIALDRLESILYRAA